MIEILKIKEVEALIDLAIKEDVGNGDHTSLACIPTQSQGQAYCIAKQQGILAGLPLAEYIFKKIDETLRFEPLKNDGDEIQNGDIIFNVFGSDISILTAERTVLNFLQRLSGIATQSKEYANLVKGMHTKILDTRKTTPGLRHLEKYAVTVGGCFNHRIGLYDMILIKDNHVDFAGGITKAIHQTLQYLKNNNLNLKIEIETRNLSEVKEVLDVGGINRIMLDNFSPELLQEAIDLIAGRFETEASGGITKETLPLYAQTGVDFISVGALTHSSKSIDLSLRAIK
ncbi:MAG: carboxylating nicotinate-nucleotide diphosphorylase [Bacteroidia bacterium]